MRALSHYWRVTRQDNVVAQALLEKATAIDPNYGQALGLLAASHTFSAHMGWSDIAIAAPIAERAAKAAIMADSQDPWAHFALGTVNMFATAASTTRWLNLNRGVAAQSELRAGARLLRPGAVLLRSLVQEAGDRCPARAALESA